MHSSKQRNKMKA